MSGRFITPLRLLASVPSLRAGIATIRLRAPDDPGATQLTRRGLFKAAGAIALVSACGDDTTTTPDTTPDDVVDTFVPDIADTFETVDTTPEEVDTEPVDTTPVDTGPEVIGVFDPTIAAESLADFPFGVQAGDPAREGAILWTRYKGAHPLELVVFEDGGEGQSGDLYVRVAAEVSKTGFVHLEVTGLATDTRYRFGFLALDGSTPTARSRIGHFRTTPSDRTLRVVTFGGTSCVNQGFRPYRTLTRASEANLDFFLMSGDGAYMDGAESLDEYRELWRQALDTDGYRALMGSTGMYSTWDDHEVYDNWDPERIVAKVLGWAKESYLDHVALRLDPEATGWKLWRKVRWGRTLEVFILDCRSERLPSTRGTANATYLSRAQMDWLKQGLRDSPCVFKIIVNTVPITDMPLTYPGDKDRWEGYEAQRSEILNHILGPPGVRGVLWLSGDFHFGAICKVDPPGKKFESLWEVFMGQGANMYNPAWPALADVPSQFPFVTGDNNFVKFVCNPLADPPIITATFIDGDGHELVSQEFQLGAEKPTIGPSP